MRRNRLWLCTVASGALLLPVGILAGLTPAGAASAPDPLQTTVQGVESAAAAAVQTTVPDEAATAPATSSGAATADSTAPLAGLPISLSAPITALANEIGATSLPAQDETSGTNTTTQTSPAANVDAPINACSFSIGLAADATSSCSTTAVGVNQTGGIGSVNVPVTAQDNAIGLVNQMASALGLTTGQSSSSTTQDGAVNVFLPVTVCSVNVGLVGSAASDCNGSGTHGATTQHGVVDAAAPVTVCDVVAEIDGNGSANCPQEPDTVSQSGQAADVDTPATACGVVAAVDGTATGACMPDAGFPEVNGLPTNSVSQSAPVDGVAPVNACSVVVAVDGTASNSCEPAHVLSTSSGSVPVTAPVTACAVTGAVDGTADGSCAGAGSGSVPIGSPGGPGTGVSAPVTICGIEAAVSGSADASCPEPTATPTNSPSAPGSSSGTSSPTTVPVSLASLAPAVASATASTGAPTGGSSLASTGAQLALEFLIGAGAVVLGAAISRLSRRRAARCCRARSSGVGQVSTTTRGASLAPERTDRGKEGSMSDHRHDTNGVITDLEDVFSLWQRRTGKFAAVATTRPRHGLRDSVSVDEHDDRTAATLRAVTARGVWPARRRLSARAGLPLGGFWQARLRRAGFARGRREGVKREDAAVVPFPTVAMDHARQRAIAAASGVAAAALVVAGLSFGPGRHGGSGSPSIAAEDPGVAMKTPPGTEGAAESSQHPSGTDGAVARAITAGALGNRTSTRAVLTAELPGGTALGPAAVPGPAGGSSALAIPASASSGAGTVGPVTATGPSPTARPASPTSAGSTSTRADASSGVGNAVTNIDNSVTTTANQLASTVPATAPVGGAVNGIGATVHALGQVLGA